jgi:hypothetical protein
MFSLHSDLACAPINLVDVDLPLGQWVDLGQLWNCGSGSRCEESGEGNAGVEHDESGVCWTWKSCRLTVGEMDGSICCEKRLVS